MATAPSSRKTTVGKPGTRASSQHMPPATRKTFGWADNWRCIEAPRWASVSESPPRVTSRPADMAASRAGICITMPSPMVRMEYFWTAAPKSMPFCNMPTARPPSRLITTMMIPAMASPFTNFIAPSRLPFSLLSISSRRRRRLASSLSIRPERRSESIDSCLPGMASRLKRAATSATRSAPLAMTMNCTTVMIRKTTRPTTRLPPATMLPKVLMIAPAWPSSRIIRVVAIDSASRNRVVISSRLGKTEMSTIEAM